MDEERDCALIEKRRVVNEIMELRMQRSKAFNDCKYEQVVKLNRKINKLRDRVEELNTIIHKRRWI